MQIQIPKTLPSQTTENLSPGDYSSAPARMHLSLLQAMSGRIVIFGAGVAGEALYHICRDWHIDVNCFCDNNRNKAGRSLYGIPVVHISEVGKRVEHPVFLISAADIVDVIEQLENLGFRKWFDSSLLLNEFDAQRHDLSVPPDFAEYVISTCIVCHQAFRNPQSIFLRSVDLVITERCSLRCRDCANLMQYYRKPRNYHLPNILEAVDRLADIVDSVNEIRVIGGEPLMSPAFSDIVKRLNKEPKFRKIIIYTNGTICPTEQRLDQLESPKILFFITNYGKLSKNLERLTTRLGEHNLRYFVQPAQGWSRCGTIGWHQRDQQELQAVFNKCCAKHVVTLMNGNLYRCPFSANASTLKAIPNYSEDSVAICEQSNLRQNLKSLKHDVLQLFSQRHALQACNYCEGRPFGAPEIEPAIQAGYPLDYTEICCSKTS